MFRDKDRQRPNLGENALVLDRGDDSINLNRQLVSRRKEISKVYIKVLLSRSLTVSPLNGFHTMAR